MADFLFDLLGEDMVAFVGEDADFMWDVPCRVVIIR